jgi:hypothetical protein
MRPKDGGTNVSEQTFRYALEFHKANGARAGQVAIAVNWDPAIESTWLLGLRRGRLQPHDSTSPSTVRPVWNLKSGQPYVSGFVVHIHSEQGGFECEFPIAYFKDAAQTAAAELVKEGRLQDGEVFQYLTTAFPDKRPAAGPTPMFTTEPVIPPLPVEDSSLEVFKHRAGLGENTGRVGDTTEVDGETIKATEAGDMPVFIPQHILDETKRLSRRAGLNETGGVLVGHLHRDTNGGEVFLEVTAQLHARQAVADSRSLTFTPETWTEAQAMLDLRNRAEVWCGWWHSHPVREWCRKCPPENQKRCPMRKDFLSGHDVQLHRTVFPRAYNIALVVNDTAVEVTHSLFGWRAGRIETRDYFIVGNHDAAAAGPASSRGHTHAT